MPAPGQFLTLARIMQRSLERLVHSQIRPMRGARLSAIRG